MRHINRVTLTGNLEADGELRPTQGGLSILKLRVASTQKYKDKAGEDKEKTAFVNCTIFGRRGESIAKFLTKGTRVAIEGAISTSGYEDKKTGEKRYSTEVSITEIEWFAKANGATAGANGNGKANSGARKPANEDADFPEDDLPFD